MGCTSFLLFFFFLSKDKNTKPSNSLSANIVSTFPELGVAMNDLLLPTKPKPQADIRALVLIDLPALLCGYGEMCIQLTTKKYQICSASSIKSSNQRTEWTRGPKCKMQRTENFSVPSKCYQQQETNLCQLDFYLGENIEVQ